MEITANQVWMMVSAALVLLMTPGLAFFYGGMTRAKAVLNMMMMNFAAAGIVGVVWVLWGYSMSGGGHDIGGLLADPFSVFGLASAVGTSDLIGAGYGATFAIIAVALISGAIADRVKFGAWMIFVPLWVTLVYAPIAYWVWGGGLLGAEGLVGSRVGEAIDFAGGTVVHINAGVAGLILALIVGKRAGFGQDPSHRPHNIPLVMIGVALLWFGWFGFNGGAADTAEQAGLIWVNTLAAPAAAMLAWISVERLRDGHPTTLGAASGIVAGLVGITPACADVSPVGALIVGLLSGVCAALAVGLKYRWGYDDSLDVVGVHLVAGLVGTLSLGFLALPRGDSAGGLFFGGGLAQLVAQTVAVLVCLVYSAAMTSIIALVIHRSMGLRISEEDESTGIDLTEHAETGYEYGGLGTTGSFVPHPATSSHLASLSRQDA